MHILHDNSLDILLLKCHAFFKCKHHYIPEVDEMTIEIAFATRSKKLQNPRVPRTGGMEAKFAGFLRELRMGAGTGGAGWASAHPGKNQGGHGPPWKF